MADAILASSGIYAIRNIQNGKMYIGSAINFKNRWKSHRSSLGLNKHHSQKLQRAWNKHGDSSFVFEILEVVENSEDLIEREQLLIDAHCSYISGYNCCPVAGSSLGRITPDAVRAKMSASRQNMSQETRAKMSAAHKGIPAPDHVKKLLSSLMKGVPKTAEHRAKLSAFRKSFVGWKHSEETKKKIGRSGPDNWNYGKTASAETKEKLKVSLTGNQNAKGFKHSDETKAKNAASNTGKRHSEETKKKIAEANTGRVFSPETLEKMRSAKLGKKMSKEARENMSAYQKTRIRAPHSQETKDKIGAKARERYAERKRNSPS